MSTWGVVLFQWPLHPISRDDYFRVSVATNYSHMKSHNCFRKVLGRITIPGEKKEEKEKFFNDLIKNQADEVCNVMHKCHVLFWKG